MDTPSQSPRSTFLTSTPFRSKANQSPVKIIKSKNGYLERLPKNLSKLVPKFISKLKFAQDGKKDEVSNTDNLTETSDNKVAEVFIKITEPEEELNDNEHILNEIPVFESSCLTRRQN